MGPRRVGHDDQVEVAVEPLCESRSTEKTIARDTRITDVIPSCQLPRNIPFFASSGAVESSTAQRAFHDIFKPVRRVRVAQQQRAHVVNTLLRYLTHV